MNNHTLLKSVAIIVEIIASIIIYYNFFDILITDGSFKGVLGVWFLIPIIALVLVQVFVTGSLVHIAMRLINRKHNATKHDAFVISGLNTTIYSLTYAIFPITGPFHYITFTLKETLLTVLFIEILWTTFTIFVIGTALKRTYSVSWFYGLLLGGISSMLILSFAS